MIDPTLRNISRLFVLSYKISDRDPARKSFEYLPLVQIKDFNALINNKLFSDQQVEKLETYK